MFVLLPMLLFVARGDDSAISPAAQGRQQVFVAPSGEPFRVRGNLPYPVADWFAGADKNGDGKLDNGEFDADFLRFFDQIDANHDGAIDSIEKNRYETEVVPETMGSSFSLAAREEDEQAPKASFSAADGDPTTVTRAKPRYGSNPVGAARFDLLGLPEPVAAMDTELRGRISRKTALVAARQRFAILDEQHRGYLTLDTLPPTYEEPGHGKRRGKQ